MAITYFIKDSEHDELITAILTGVEKIKENVQGIYYIWESGYFGRHGKKQNYKVLKVYEGLKKDQPRNFKQCTSEIFEKAKIQVGKVYYGWDEPTISEFSN